MKSKLIDKLLDALKGLGGNPRPALQPVPVRNNPRFGR